MGDPKKVRKKYSGPVHPWQSKRIEAEKILTQEYGLKNKKELWKANSLLKNFASQAKKLIAVKTQQGEKERKQLFQRLEKLGLLKPGAALDDILELSIRDILERRLQTLVCKKELAKTVKQARQFITHQHISVNKKLITVPSYLVKVKEEPSIIFLESSTLAKEDHPERVKEEVEKSTSKLAKESKTTRPRKVIRPRRGKRR